MVEDNMKHRIPLILLLLISYASSLYGAGYEAPPEIVATLPRFCWRQYLKNAPEGPEFEIRDCGSYANHYCIGLVDLALADRAKTPATRLQKLREAKESMEYTLHWTEDVPECFLRPLARANLQRIDFQLDMMKWKRSR